MTAEPLAEGADACLVNRYQPRSRLSLHQDRNENDFGQPIVSVSLGLPAVFLFGGLRRTEKPSRVEDGSHALVGRHRVNLTFRKAG